MLAAGIRAKRISGREIFDSLIPPEAPDLSRFERLIRISEARARQARKNGGNGGAK